jgi:hypothetical protein
MIAVNTTYSLGVTLNTINDGTDRSDHASFWTRGYSAILLIEHFNNGTGGDFNPYYHTVNDRIINFNLPYYHKMSRLAFGTLATLALANEPLPVELSSFTAAYINSSVLLKWRTETEVNNYGFSIERRVNGENWQSIAFVQGYGNSNSPKEYSYIDLDIFAGGTTFHYRLKQIDNDGFYKYSEQVEVEIPISQYMLSQNFPNPFNPSTRINYFVPQESFVSIKVYDFLGREVMTLVNETKSVGSYEIVFDASNLPSGTYFYTMIAGNYSATKKMILLK